MIFFQMFTAAKVVLFSDISKCFCEKVVFIPLFRIFVTNGELT